MDVGINEPRNQIFAGTIDPSRCAGRHQRLGGDGRDPITLDEHGGIRQRRRAGAVYDGDILYRHRLGGHAPHHKMKQGQSAQAAPPVGTARLASHWFAGHGSSPYKNAAFWPGP